MAMNMAGSSGGGRRGRRKPVMAEINVTPMVDVMLVLLIIFMVSAPLLTVGVPLDLPQTQAKSLDQDKNPLTLSVNLKGQVFLNDTEIGIEELVPKLKAITDARGGLDERIFVRGDKKVDYGTVMKVKVDKTLIASVALHVLVLGWGLVSFSARSLEAPPPESMPVDIISSEQLSQITAGLKTGEKDKPKPLVEKIADPKPAEDAVGKITEKKEVVTSAAPEPPPKPVEKPVEKKPDPPKPVVENKPKDEPKPSEKKPDPPKVDAIAEALKSENAKKPVPKPEAKAAPPQPPKPNPERIFDQSKIAALLDKRDPTRQSITGAALNSSASLGSTRGTAATLSQSALDAMRARLKGLWNVPAGIEHPEEMVVVVQVRLTPDRRLAAPPQIISRGTSPGYQVAAEAAVRALLQGQPFNMLRAETYDIL